MEYWLRHSRSEGRGKNDILEWNTKMIDKIIHDIDIIKLFMKYKDITIEDNYAIRLASKNGHLEVISLLLKRRGQSEGSESVGRCVAKQLVPLGLVDPSARDNEAIRYASEKGHLDVVSLLLQQKGVDPSAINNYAIRYASENGHLEVVKLLLQRPDVDPSANNNWAIELASYNGYLEIVKLLLKQPSVDPSADDNEAIRWASKNGYFEVVKLLLQQPSVKNSLSKKYYEKYLKLIKNN